MNQVIRYSLVGASLVTFLWAGCSSDEPTPAPLPATGSTTSGMGSTGTMGAGGAGSSVSSSTIVTTTGAATTTTGGGAPYECNPVTNEPCAAGDACDLSQEGGFVCFPPPNDQNTCEPCDNANGPFCQGTNACVEGSCAKYCCTSDDCGPSAECVLGVFGDLGFPEIGVCDAMPPMGTGGGGGAGGAGGGSTGTPGCDDVPAMPPSNGSCVPFP